jgi:four helix bundle protein
MKYYTYSFEKLEVWQRARELKVKIYETTRGFPKEELFGLTSQIRRSSGSITANLAEGAGRATDKDKAYFTNNAYSSALEAIDHLITSYDFNYISEKEYSDFRLILDEIINKLNSIYKHQVKRNKRL